MALSLLRKISPPASSIFSLSLSLHLSVRLPFFFYTDGERKARGTVLGMIRWMNSSLLGAYHEDMVVFECVTVADEGCRCLEGCYGEVLRDCVFQPGYGGLCDACWCQCACAERVDGWGSMGVII